MKKLRKLDLCLHTTSLPTGSTDLKTVNTSTYEGRVSVDEAHSFVDLALKESIYEELTLEKYFDTVNLPKNHGKTYTFRKMTKYDAKINDLVEGVIPPEDAPMGILEYTVALSNYGGYTTYTDDLEIFSLNNGNLARISRNQGDSVGEKLNYKYRDALYASTNRWYAGLTSAPASLAAARAGLTMFQLDDLRKISTFFKKFHIQPFKDGFYVVAMPAEVEQSLYSLKKSGANDPYSFVEIQNYRAAQQKPIFENEIGTWLNFKFVSEPSLGVLKDASGNDIVNDSTHQLPVFGCVILGRYKGEKGAKAIKLEGEGAPKSIIKDVTSGGAKENPLNQIGSVGWKLKGHGLTVLYDEAVMVYECLSDMAEIEWNENEIDQARAEFARGVDGKVTGNHATNARGKIVPEATTALTKGTKTDIVDGTPTAPLPATTPNT